MPRLKYFNDATQEWEYVIVGGQGPQGVQGEPGVVSATDPIIYNAETQNVSFGNPDYITFDTTPETSSTTPGTIYWDNGEGTPTVVVNPNVNLNLGQENIALCYNGTGSAITNGSVVYISGAQGQRPSITLADADTEATSSKTFGMATEDIPTGTEGFVATFGIVNGIDTASFTEGQALWLSQTAGQVTATRPLAPAHTVFVGYCLKSNASSGRIFINPQNGYELNELHDVLIEETIADNELIARDFASGLWKNQTAAEAGLSELGHTHDDRYYTETEVDTLLSGKADTSHTHSASSITSGVLSISQGGTGVTVGAGLTPVIPSSVSVNSGSASVAADGTITYSGVGTIDIDGIFSSTYRNYRLVGQVATTANPSEWQSMQFRNSSGHNFAATYESLYAEMNNSGGWNAREVQFNTTSAKIWPTGNYFGNISYDFYGPNLVLFTNVLGLNTYVNAGGFTAGVMQLGSRENTSYTGIRFFGTGMSGSIKFYGYN